MSNDDASEVAKLRDAIAALETQQGEFGLDLSAQIAELRQRLDDTRRASQKGSGVSAAPGQGARGRHPRVRTSQKGSGATATTGGVAAGKSGIAVGGDVVGDIYHVYRCVSIPTGAACADPKAL